MNGIAVVIIVGGGYPYECVENALGKRYGVF